MRKTILLVIVAAVLLTAQPARATTAPAYYASTDYQGALLYRQWTRLDLAYFTDVRDGGIKLVGDTFRPKYEGLISVSGTCQLERAPVHWYMTLWVYDEPYSVIDTTGQAASFAVTVPAANMALLGYQSNPEPNGIKCALLFEPV
jgi:hypothetical protein